LPGAVLRVRLVGLRQKTAPAPVRSPTKRTLNCFSVFSFCFN
jgi:hypothetical protein